MVHPGFELAGSGKPVPVFQHPQKNILHHVFTALSFSRHMKQEAEQRLVVTLKEQAHFIQIAVLYL